MSQQINLINLRWRPPRDLLSLSLILGAFLLVLVLEGAFYVKASLARRQLVQVEEGLTAEGAGLRQQVDSLEKLVGERKPNAELAKEVAGLKAALIPREEALRVLMESVGDNAGFSDYFGGFTRQALDGVWLTSFAISKSEIVIRGRLSDSSLLPHYIRRLNAEKSFQGRRFAALEMKGVEPPTPKPSPTPTATPKPSGTPLPLKPPAANAPASPPYFVEFSLLGTVAAGKPATGG